MNIKKSFSVGLPCMKLSLNPSNQKHNGKAAKTCSVGSAWEEMSDKRRGKDKSIDKNLTENNVWLIGDTDIDMVGVVQAEVDAISAERKEYGKRALRKDTVSAIEMIEKVPIEVMMELSREEQIELLKISNEVYEELLHEWAPEWKTHAAVIHFDEWGGKSPHTHRIVTTTTIDENGIHNMNAKQDFNLKFFTFINTNYPKRMRERGIPVKDCQSYEQMTEEEKVEHKEKKKEYGVDAVTYKIKKAVELDDKIHFQEQKSIQLQEDFKANMNENFDMKAQNKELTNENKKLQEENEKIKKEYQDTEKQVNRLKEYSKIYTEGIEEFDESKWEIPDPPKLIKASVYKEKYIKPFVKKLLKKLISLQKKCNGFMIEIKNLNKRLDDESKRRYKAEENGNMIARKYLEANDIAKKFSFIERVLGKDKTEEIVNQGIQLVERETQEREQERRQRKSRKVELSL